MPVPARTSSPNSMQNSIRPFPNRVCPMIVPPSSLPLPLFLFTGLLLLTRTDEKGVPQVPTVPAGERPGHDDLGGYHHLDGRTEERDGLTVLKLIVADLGLHII